LLFLVFSNVFLLARLLQFTSYRNLKTSSSQVLTGSCSDCRIPAVIRFIDLVSPQYWAQAAEYCNSGQKKDNTAAQVNAQRQPNQKIRVTPEGFLRRQNKEFDRETKTRLGDTELRYWRKLERNFEPPVRAGRARIRVVSVLVSCHAHDSDTDDLALGVEAEQKAQAS
jgi:hypothetical protein